MFLTDKNLKGTDSKNENKRSLYTHKVKKRRGRQVQ
jgi:hypothetical protein